MAKCHILMCALLVLLAVGCIKGINTTTQTYKSKFESLTPGMTKESVIELMGNPSASPQLVSAMYKEAQSLETDKPIAFKNQASSGEVADKDKDTNSEEFEYGPFDIPNPDTGRKKRFYYRLRINEGKLVAADSFAWGIR